MNLLFISFAAAELLIYKENAEPVEIHSARRRALMVQWPTVMAFMNMQPKTEQEIEYFKHVNSYLSCIKTNEGKCSLKIATQMLPGFKVTWLPDTIFQLAMLFVLRRNFMFLEGEDAFLMDELGLVEAGAPNFNEKIRGSSSLQDFMQRCVDFDNHEQLNQLYLETVKYLRGSNNMAASWSAMVDTMLTNIVKMEGNTIENRPSSTWLSTGHASILKVYVEKEVEAEAANQFLLSRGTKGIDLVAIFDEGTEMHRFEFVKAMDFPNMKHSISLSPHILDGSVYDWGEGGARSLDYFTEHQKGYLLKLKISDYLKGLQAQFNSSNGKVTLFNLLYIPALSAVGGLFGGGELFHVRTKLGRDAPKGGFLPGQNREVMKRDRHEQLSIFRENLSSEWLYSLLKLFTQVEPLIADEEFDLRKNGQALLLSYLDSDNVSFQQEGVEVFTTAIPIPAQRYNRDNDYYQMMKMETWRPVMAAIEPLTKIHTLVFPEKGKFVNFWDFIYYASNEQLETFFRHIASAITPELQSTGFRFVIDSYGPHLYASIGGGEPLKPILDSCIEEPEDEDLTYDVGIEIKVFKNETTEFVFDITKGGKACPSLFEFAKNASAFEIRKLGQAILRTAAKHQFLHDGFRIYHNHGSCDYLKEKRFRLHVVYGNHLGSPFVKC